MHGGQAEQLGRAGAVAAGRARSRRASVAARRCRRGARDGRRGEAAAIACRTPVITAQAPSIPTMMIGDVSSALDTLVARERVGDVGRDDERDHAEQRR